MRIRLGYVSISKTIYNYISFKSITYTNYKKYNDIKIIEDIIKSNLNNLYEILLYNKKNNIHFYRVSSNLIPLSTKSDVEFNYLDNYKDYYEKIGNLVRESNIRIDMHASNYCILNSTKEEVVKSSIEMLKYNYQLMDIMGIKNKIIILHIGSSVLGKKNSISRFINNFFKLPKYLQDIIVIENDDKVFNIEDCLFISDKLNIPVVLDYHHFNCNNSGNSIECYLDKIIESWNGKIPKMHFSSPKNKREFRSHNDYIDVEEFMKFINILFKYNRDIDIMLEAKEKDEALFRLVRELKYKSNYKFIDDTSFEII